LDNNQPHSKNEETLDIDGDFYKIGGHVSIIKPKIPIWIEISMTKPRAIVMTSAEICIVDLNKTLIGIWNMIDMMEVIIFFLVMYKTI